MATTATKRRFLAELGPMLGQLGYGIVPGPTIVSGLFWKRHEDLVLMLCVDFSRRYAERVTCSFYLSRSFAFSVPFRNLPHWVYVRLGHFLTTEERARLLPPEFQREGVVDAWWIGATSETCASLVSAVKLTEPRYLGQPGLLEAVRCNEDAAERRALDEEVARSERAGVTATGLKHQPKRYPKEVPPEWFWAAEVVATAHRSPYLSAAYTEMLALDAWRVATLLGT